MSAKEGSVCPPCFEPGCESPAARSGMCWKHVKQKQRHGEAGTNDGRLRMKKYGLSQREFETMLARQGGRCAICRGGDPGSKGWHLDHDHRFPRRDPRGWRGVLCMLCNMMLGMARDTPEILGRAISYLEDHQLNLTEQKVDGWVELGKAGRVAEMCAALIEQGGDPCA